MKRQYWISFLVVSTLVVGFNNCSRVFEAMSFSSSSSSSGLRPQTVGATKYGIFYSIWHCQAADAPQDISLGQLGAYGSLHWWGKPTLGYYCPTRDRAVIRSHAQLIRDAGIDFVYVDATNFADTSDQAQTMVLQPLRTLLEEWSTVPGAPKISVWLPLSAGATLPDAVDALLSQYPDLLFRYQGKPLMEVVEQPLFPIDPATFDRFAQKYTLRRMWGLYGAASANRTSWSFMEICQAGFKASNGTGPCNQRVAYGADGQVEQISVTAAYQMNYMSDTSTAVPKFEGRTLQAQMRVIDQYPNVPIVTITGWNEWVAQRFCINGGPSVNCNAATQNTIAGNPVFVDEFNDEYSRDIEPGGAFGDRLYQVMTAEIKNRKNGSSNVIGHVDAVTGGNGQVVISGWACATYLQNPIDVHLYAGGAAGSGGHAVTAAAANQASEVAVSDACGDPSNSPHRFSIILDAATARANVGQTVFVHGISPVGRPNLAIENSGVFTIPDPGTPPVDAGAQVAAPAQPAGDQAAAQQAAAQQAAAQQAAAQQAAAQQAAAQQAAAQQAAAQAGPQESWNNVYRMYQPATEEHFYTANADEGSRNGFTMEGIGFRVLATQLSGSHPIYRCLSAGRHFVSGDAGCEGSTNEGTYGFLYDGPGAGRILLYRLSRTLDVTDHLISSTPTEGTGMGFVLEGPVGYTK